VNLKDNNCQLLVVDIDGTLLNKDGVISSEDKEAITGVVGKGIRVSLSTGRVALAAQKIIDQLSLDSYHIFFDGALVSNPGNNKEIYIKPIDAELVRQAVKYARRHEVEIDFYSATQYFIEHESWVTDIRRDFFGLKSTITDFNELWRKETIIKGTIVVRTDEEKLKAGEFCDYFENNLNFSRTDTPAYPGVDFINVIASGVSKGTALETLAAHLGIPLSGIMAIGDGDNDISLLSTAGLGIAMGNALDELKEVADYVTLDVENSGVSAAIKRFLTV
jgi:Cof subfamily protein (haloacid dehalogenase superfamily)